MSRVHIGAYGQTVFSLLLSEHLGGSKLQLRGRKGSVQIGQREIEVIAGLAEIFGVECDQATVSALTDKIYGKQMKDMPLEREAELEQALEDTTLLLKLHIGQAADSAAHDNPLPKYEQCSNPRCARYMPGYRPLCSNCKRAFGEAR